MQNNSLFTDRSYSHRNLNFSAVSLLFFSLPHWYRYTPLGTATDSRILEHFAALLLAIIAYLRWYYAYRKGGLVADDIPAAKSAELLKRNMARSYTALLTMSFTFAGSISWKLSWFYTRLFAGYLAV